MKVILKSIDVVIGIVLIDCNYNYNWLLLLLSLFTSI